MKQDETEGRILWCLQKKDGIRLGEPNENMAISYAAMSNESLKSLRLNVEAGIRNWSLITAYYARYDIVYALLMKCGIKSEIHDCSIALFGFLFPGHQELFAELELAKQHRINVQYYTNRIVSESDFRKNVESAPEFVLKVEKLISSLGQTEISATRGKLSRIKIL